MTKPTQPTGEVMPDLDTIAPDGSRVGYVVLAKTGRAELAYLPAQAAPLPVSVQPAALPAPTVIVQQDRQLDPVTTRIAAASAGATGIAWAVGHYAHQLTEFAHAAVPACIAVGVAAVGVGLARSSQPKVNVNVSATITGATAQGGSAHSTARSVSGWKNSG